MTNIRGAVIERKGETHETEKHYRIFYRNVTTMECCRFRTRGGKHRWIPVASLRKLLRKAAGADGMPDDVN